MNRREAISMVAGFGMVPAEATIEAFTKKEDEQVLALVFTSPEGEDDGCVDEISCRNAMKGTPLEKVPVFTLPYGWTLDMLKLSKKEIEQLTKFISQRKEICNDE